MDTDTVAIIAVTLLLEEDEEEITQKAKKRRKQRACWVRPLFLEKNGFFSSFRAKLMAKDPELFLNFVRMTEDDFDFLLNRVTPLIEKQDTCMRDAISAEERLVITLRFLATGDSYGSLMFLFKRSRSSICKIIPEVCSAIYKTLKGEFLKVPSTEETWTEISNEIKDRWNFPNAIGALDGKHIDIIAPAHCGSDYFNYKKRNSIVLMALVDAKYNFIYVDVGAKGRESDGGVFNRCVLQKAIEDERLQLPQPKPLPGRQKPVPYVIVADDAFALKPYLMKPYKFRNQSTQERVFNYRLSRFRRVSENVFGLISARFRVVRKSIEVSPQNAETIVLAVCVLHNFLSKRRVSKYAQAMDYDQINADGTVIEGRWRQEVSEAERMVSISVPHNEGRNCNLAKEIREEFKKYFMKEGDVPWQYKNIY